MQRRQFRSLYREGLRYILLSLQWPTVALLLTRCSLVAHRSVSQHCGQEPVMAHGYTHRVEKQHECNLVVEDLSEASANAGKVAGELSNR